MLRPWRRRPSRASTQSSPAPEDHAFGRLFDAGWYVATYPDVKDCGRSPLAHYLEVGSARGRRPNPLFQPEWYRSQNPDVAESGDEPLDHYLASGWKEGRDPGPAFSVSDYLAANPDVAETGFEPLSHYLYFGQAEGRPPGRLLSCLDVARPRVAIIIAAQEEPAVRGGRPSPLSLLLDSLRRAATATAFQVLVTKIDTHEAEEAIRSTVTAFAALGLPVALAERPEGTGLGGATNAAIKQALAGGFTHICLLDPAVVVTDRWLDRLLDTTEPVVGPVSNAIGSEGTIPVDYEVDRHEDAWPQINRYAQVRRGAWRPAVAYAQTLGGVALLLRRDVIERGGFLDEQSLSAELAAGAYRARLRTIGYNLAIARSVFVHHWDSRPSDETVAEVSRARATGQEDRAHLQLVSWAQDQTLAAAATGGAERDLQTSTLNAHATMGLKTAGKLAEVAASRESDRRAAERQAETRARVTGRLLAEFGDSPIVLTPADFSSSSAYAAMLQTYWAQLRCGDMMNFAHLSGAQALLVTVARTIVGRSGILVFCDTDPADCDPNGGYAQRVIAIDRLFAGQARFYVRYGEPWRGRPVLREVAKDVLVLWIADRDGVAEALLDAIARVTKIYVHSILSVGISTSRRIVLTHTQNVTLDLHGAVPEEFGLNRDPFQAQTFEAFESTICRSVAKLVCVTRTMARHIEDKHGALPARPVICPIFISSVKARAPVPAERDRPRVIYAGGTQRWQQIPKMLDLIVETSSLYRFLVLTPQTDTIEQGFAKRGTRAQDHGVCVRSARADEVLDLLPEFDFGLLLREESVVNLVSCPTKLIEYLACGVVPVLDSEKVGDFVELGMMFVPLEEFRRGDIPKAEVRADMANANLRVLDRLRAISDSGQREIADRMRGNAPFLGKVMA